MAVYKHCPEVSDLKRDLYITYKDKVLRLVLPKDQVVTKRDVCEVISSAFGFSSVKCIYMKENDTNVCIHNEKSFQQAVYVNKITNFEIDGDLDTSENITPCSYGEILIQENDSSSINLLANMVDRSDETNSIIADPNLDGLLITEADSRTTEHHLDNVPSVCADCFQSPVISSTHSDMTFYYQTGKYEQTVKKDISLSGGAKPKNVKKEIDEKLFETCNKYFLEQVKKKKIKKTKKESTDTATPIPDETSTSLPHTESECSKSNSLPKSDKNKKDKREKKHKSCMIVKNHPLLSCVKENCTTKYEEWKKIIQKYVNPETSEKPPKWFIEFMRQYKQDLIHDVVHKTTRRILKATEGMSSPLDCCRSKSYLKVQNAIDEKENSSSVDIKKLPEPVSDSKSLHGKVICDSCNNFIEGVWYRCCNCSDYDLCETCENKPDVHDINHVFLKIKRPLTTHGKHFLRRKSPIFSHTLYEEAVLPSVESKFQLTFYDCKFIKDETIPDGTVLRPQTRFIKSWLIRNSGNVPWDADVKLQFMWGTLPPRKCEIRVPPLDIGVEDLISIELCAPDKPGHYESHWQLQRHKRRFGPRIWCIIEVEDEKPISNHLGDESIPKLILKTSPDNVPRPLEKESVYTSVNEFISQTATPNNTPLEFSPPRTPDPNVDLLGIVKNMANSATNENHPEKKQSDKTIPIFEEPLSDHCPQEFFVDAEETTPEEYETPLSPMKPSSGILSPTDSSMEVLSEDDDDNEIPEMATTLNTSILSSCSETDYVMVPWPECFVFESSDGERSKDDDVIICQRSPSDDNGEGISDYVPGFFKYNNQSEFLFNNKSEEKTNNSDYSCPEIFFQNCVSKPFINDHEINNTYCSQLEEVNIKSEVSLETFDLSLNKDKQIKNVPEMNKVCTFHHPSEVRVLLSEQKTVNNLPMQLPGVNYVGSSEVKPSKSSPKVQSLPVKSMNTVSAIKNHGAGMLMSSVDPVVGETSSISSEITSHCNLQKDLFAISEMSHNKVEHSQHSEPKCSNSIISISTENNLTSSFPKEVKEKVIVLSSSASDEADHSHHCVEDSVSSKPCGIIEWNQILDEQMRPQSASKVATNIMNSALTAGALAFNTAKAVFTTLQAKQPKQDQQIVLMDQLMEMGFCNRPLNETLLQESQDLNEVVAKLIELYDNDWHQHH